MSICITHDTIEIDVFSGAGLCVLCDNAVEEHDIGIVVKDGHAYLAHAGCIRMAHEEDED